MTAAKVLDYIKNWLIQKWKEIVCRHDWTPVYHSYVCKKCGKWDMEY